MGDARDQAPTPERVHAGAARSLVTNKTVSVCAGYGDTTEFSHGTPRGHDEGAGFPTRRASPRWVSVALNARANARDNHPRIIWNDSGGVSSEPLWTRDHARYSFSATAQRSRSRLEPCATVTVQTDLAHELGQ
jgi:hypothetical protein